MDEADALIKKMKTKNDEQTTRKNAPDRMSSMRSSMHAASTADLSACARTAYVSNTPCADMSAMTPFTPSMPAERGKARVVV